MLGAHARFSSLTRRGAISVANLLGLEEAEAKGVEAKAGREEEKASGKEAGVKEKEGHLLQCLCIG